MKRIVILLDGVADFPIAQWGNRTPLQVAHTPCMDYLASLGKSGLLATTTPGFVTDSDTTHLSILGYNVPAVYSGRAFLECVGMNQPLAHNETLFRCNLIHIEQEKISTHNPLSINTEESLSIIRSLQKELDPTRKSIRFMHGGGFKHLVAIKEADSDVTCIAPHYALGASIKTVLPASKSPSSNKTANTLIHLIKLSQEILREHPTNYKRTQNNQKAICGIWLWSPSTPTVLPPLNQMWNFTSGAMIAGASLIKGIGKLAGLHLIEVKGATGSHPTNYRGKAEAAISALEKHDFIFLHVEACDEVAHQGNFELKRRVIETIDKDLISPILHATKRSHKAIRVAILPDHYTSTLSRSHAPNPVPFVIYDSNNTSVADKTQTFDEESASHGIYGLLKGDEFFRILFS